MMRMEAGYNIVEWDAIGEDFERIEERISIVEFLRRIVHGPDLPSEICVVGLDKAFEGAADAKQLAHEIWRALRESSSRRRLTGVAVQIPVARLSHARTLGIRLQDGKEVRLSWLFGGIDPIGTRGAHSVSTAS